MVGLVAHVLPVAIVREGYAAADEVIESLGRMLGFAQRDVAVHAAALEQVLRHQPRRVQRSMGQRELVVGLLVRTGLVRCPGAPALRDQHDVTLPMRQELQRRIQRGGPAADDQRVRGMRG